MGSIPAVAVDPNVGFSVIPSRRGQAAPGIFKPRAMMPVPTDPRKRHLEIVAWALVIGVFGLDLNAWRGYAAHLLYSPVILLALWTPGEQVALRLAAAVTVLSATTHFLLPLGTDLGAALFNRIASAVVLWVTAAGVTAYRRQKAAQEAERTRAEATLTRTLKDLEDFKSALDQSAILATTDVQGTITYVNDKFCEISKYSRAELIGQNHRLLNSGFHPLEFFREMYRTIANGGVWHGEIRNRAKDGTLYWVDTTIVPFLDAHRRPYQYVAIRYDITDRKRSEAALREQAALAKLGKMAAVVAHEVRNPLAGIRGALQIIGKRLTTGSQEHAISHEVISRIDTLNGIVEDLLLFARPKPPVLARVPLATVLHETVTLLRSDPKFAEIAISINAADTRVLADPEQLKLVLVNLLINAAQAMGGRGQVNVTVESSDGWHVVQIRDQGPGIPADVQEHLFEPFFTTKHRGTGLGLATARRILEGHGGTIELISPAGGGTIALIRLQAA